MFSQAGRALYLCFIQWPFAAVNATIIRPTVFAVRIITLPPRVILAYLWSSVLLSFDLIRNFEVSTYVTEPPE